MPPLPVVSGWEAVLTFQAFGWRYVRRRNGHFVMIKSGVKVNLSLPDHNEVDTGLLRSQIRKAEIDVEQFIEALKAL